MRTEITLGIALTIISAPAAAHHSASIFDRESVVAFQGTVNRYSWTNPHVYIYVETEDEAGNLVEWEIETDATPILTRSGWTAETFMPGDTVRVRANPDKNAQRQHALLSTIEKEDGTVFSARSYFLRRTDDSQSLASASDLSGRWEMRFSDYNRYYAGWADIELTEKGAAGSAAYNVRTDSPAAQCVAAPLPSILVAPYLSEIELREDTIIIRNERFNAERTVYMDGREHPENGEGTNQGHSIGRWEGDTLIIDTTLFAAHRAPISGQQGNEGVPSGEDKHVVERYTLSGDGTRILIDFVLEDSEYLAEPFAGSVEWYYAPHFEMLGFGCNADVSRRYTLQ